MKRFAAFVLVMLSVVLITVLVSCGNVSEGQTALGDPRTIHGMTFVTIPGGTFRMGDIQNYNVFSLEKPVHDVTISSFEMSIH